MPPVPLLSPLQEAQELIYEAWNEPIPQMRIALAQKALTISPNCADAYNLLAGEKAETVAETYQLYEQGMAAGKRAIGDEFEEFYGHFWGIVKTRPYMRAREGVIDCLWKLGRKDEAITHCQQMLNLNPSDNQGIRYTLLMALFTIKEFEAAETLLAQYEREVSVYWLYGRVILDFHKHGATSPTKKALKAAMKSNVHVPYYLLDRLRMPKQSEPFIQAGSHSEAAVYVKMNWEVWLQNRELFAWLKRVVVRL